MTYKIEFDNGDARVSGGEPDRLTAFFDSRERLHVVLNAGTVGKSNIDVVISDDHPDNVVWHSVLDFWTAFHKWRPDILMKVLLLKALKAPVMEIRSPSHLALTIPQSAFCL